MTTTTNELTDEMKQILDQHFHDYYQIERERRIQDTLSGESSFHRKTVAEAFDELKQAIELKLWEKSK